MIEETTNDEVFELKESTIPVSHLSLEPGVSVPIGGWAATFESMNIKTVTDPAGRQAIDVLAARRLLKSIKRQDELFLEDAQRRTAELARKHPVPVTAGVPMTEGVSAFESLAVAAGGVVSVEAEFGSGREKPNFLKDELEAGRRADAEKLRLAKSLKDKLGGKT